MITGLLLTGDLVLNNHSEILLELINNQCIILASFLDFPGINYISYYYEQKCQCHSECPAA